MIKQPLYTTLLLFILVTTPVAANASERLYYRLSYSGLITGFLSKALADVSLNLEAEATQFRNDEACRLSMDVDTSGYLFAEMLHPVRFHWESTLSPNLRKTLLARAIDSGQSDTHEVSWYDWESRTISLFRKRREIDLNRNVYKADEKLAWERDIHAPPAPFIDPFPPIDNGLSQLIQTKQLKGALSDPAIDPLTMIQRVRVHNFNQKEKVQMLVALDEELHHYQAQMRDREPLQLSKKRYDSTLKVEITRTSSKGRKGAMTLWLSDTPKRQPLRIDIKAPLGMIHLELVRTEENIDSKTCSPLRMGLG
ncbi:MAG: DUF3108 domain-containing protein [Gammaproteobacteria bacterium]|nr:DUF3108 domain-containing protein [Gammaproteobacteria bacterium]